MIVIAQKCPEWYAAILNSDPLGSGERLDVGGLIGLGEGACGH